MSGSGEWVKKKMVEIASDIGTSGKEVELGENEEPEEGLTEAMLFLKKTQIEEKTSLEDMKRMESEQDISEVRDVSKCTSIVCAELGKDVKTEEVTEVAVF